jgi:internalin A
MARERPEKQPALASNNNPEAIAEERIAEAMRTGATQLRLSHLGLTTLPASIAKLRHLRALFLHDNELCDLSPSLSGLKELQILDLRNNKFCELPVFVGEFERLQELYLGSNKFTNLNAFITQLKNLQALGFADNQLRELPAAIGELKHLRALHLNDNKLRELPNSIGTLKQLEHLYLNGNHLRELPTSFAELRQLRSLNLQGNSDLGLPQEVIAKRDSPTEICDYYFAQRKRVATSGARPLNEAKVLVLGEAEVGKSSVIHALTEGLPVPSFDKTHGIVRKEWKVPIAGERLAKEAEANAEEKLRLNLWDFGGQEVYKHTHTFFLTHRAVYLIVADARANDRQNNLDYWLEMAKSFGGGARVWVAVNKCDEHGDGPDEHALRRKFPALRGFTRTSCRSGEGIETLKQQLVAEALKLDGVRQPMNNIWLSIKTALEETKEDTIPFNRYLDLCREKGENEDAMQTQLLDLWDKLGTVRYFPTHTDDPPEMRDTAILNPDWVTKGVYAVLDDAGIRERGGLLTEADLAGILQGAGYQAGRHHLVQQVMRRFDLLYDTPEHDPHKILVPQLLPEKQPKIAWPTDGTLRFFYRYPVLPAALVPTFIARMHRWLSRAPGPWRHGCVLKFAHSCALVVGDAEAKQVEINVTGEPIACRDALDAVRFTFENIHGAIKDLIVDELIPVPKRPEAPLLDYRHMRALDWNGETTFNAKGIAPGEIIKVDVGEVLNGVRGEKKRRADELGRAPTVIYDRRIMGDQITTSVTGSTTGHITTGKNQTFTECFKTAEHAAQPDVQQALKALILEVQNIHPQLAAGDRDKAERRLKTITEEAAVSEPDKEQLAVSSKGLIDAAKTCAAMAPSVVTAVKAVLGLFGVTLS